MRKLALIVIGMSAAPALAQTAFQDTVSLDRAVAAFAGRPIGTEGGARTSVDTRLRLAACSTIALSWRSEAHDAVVINCTGPEWRIYVPMMMPPPTAAAAAPAAIATPGLAKPEIVIKRGDPVTVQAGAPGFSVTRDGVAMSEAPVGGRFLVDVAGTRKPIQAVAIGAGVATLPGWAE